MEHLPVESRRSAGNRWELIRDVAAFQLKLAVDAFRDFVFSPLSLVAAVLDLLRGGDRPGRLFYRVMAAGLTTEDWINLFGGTDRDSEVAPRRPTVDALVAQVERLVVEQYERGGMTAAAKDAIDRSLDAIPRKRSD